MSKIIPENLSGQIRKARAAFGISRTFLGEILGFGINQIRLYEKGEIPNKSNYLALKLALTPFGMKSYLTNSPSIIKNRKQFAKLYFKVQTMCLEIEQELQRSKAHMNENYLNRCVPSELKIPNTKKLKK